MVVANIQESAIASDAPSANVIFIVNVTPESASGSALFSGKVDFGVAVQESAQSSITISAVANFSVLIQELGIASDSTSVRFLWELINASQPDTWSTINNQNGVTWVVINTSETTNWQSVSTLN